MSVRQDLDLKQLAAAIESIEQRCGGPGAIAAAGGCGSGRVACDAAHSAGGFPSHLGTAWPAIDDALGGGLRWGGVHEWFPHDAKGLWFPPLAIFIHLAWRAMMGTDDDPAVNGVVVWIGKCCRPNPRALIRDSSSPIDGADAHDRTLLSRSLLVDPPDDASRLWAIDLALRSRAVAMVIADGSRLDMAATRRLQLAAEAGRSIALLARPPQELPELSAATTRWTVQPNFGFQISNLRLQIPRWIVHLLRCKGMRPASQTATAQPRWAVEWNGAQGFVHQSANVVDRSGSPARSPSVQRPAIAARRSA